MGASISKSERKAKDDTEEFGGKRAILSFMTYSPDISHITYTPRTFGRFSLIDLHRIISHDAIKRFRRLQGSGLDTGPQCQLLKAPPRWVPPDAPHFGGSGLPLVLELSPDENTLVAGMGWERQHKEIIV